jgi:long-chain acyl-CoA synthetase
MEYGLAAHARERADKPALVLGDRVLTFGVLDRRVNRLANALRSLEVGIGDRVALMLRNGFEWFEGTHAAGKIGATIVPVNHHFKREEIAYLLEDSGAKAMLFDVEFAGELAGLGGQRAFLAIDARGSGASAATASRAAVTAAPVPAGSASWLPYETALERASDEPPPAGRPRRVDHRVEPGPRESGRPKGVVHPQMDPEIGYQMQIRWAEAWGFRTDDVHLLVGPAYHTAPGGYSHLHLFLGATVVILGKFDAGEALGLIARHRVTTTHMVPVNFIRILALPEATRRHHDLSSLRRVLHAAAPCPEDVKWRILDVFPADSVWEYYGATEGPGTIISPQEWRRKPGSVGRPWPGIEVRILDEGGNRLPAGEVGLVYLSTPGGRGFEYHNDPAKTASAYREGFFTVGDVGFLDDDGYLFLTDRKSDMVISGGVNIYPREIEEVLHRHPAVADVAVFGIPDEQWGESLKAVVEPRADAAVSVDALAAFCREHLADYKCPRSFDLVAELPRDPNGKVLKRRLRDPWWEGRPRRV